MLVIAFGHEKNVGKDSACKFATTHLRVDRKIRNVKRVGFADKLKQGCYELYSWAGLMPGPFYDEDQNRHLKEVILPLIGKSPRMIWIQYGQRIREFIYADTWIDYVFRTVVADVLFISDLRFPEEADAIKKRGGLVVKITRESVPHTSDEADDPLLSYTSWDGHILNNWDLNTFYTNVISFVNPLVV